MNPEAIEPLTHINVNVNMELLIEISSDHKKSPSRKTKNPFRTSQMY